MARLTVGKTSKGGVGCLVLFGLPFAGVGVFMACLTVSTLWTWSAMRSWDEVPAHVQHTNLNVDSGDDGSTYNCVASYTYEYQGRAYTGTRVAISRSSDNIGSFHQNAHRELSHHRDSGQPFRCYVDPDDPSQAVLYRDLRWEMLLLYSVFVVTFGGFGFGAMGAAVYGGRKVREAGQLQKRHVDEPWRWKPEWATGEIRSSTRATLFASIVFTIFWNAIAFPIGTIIVREAVFEGGDNRALLVLIFPAIGLLMVAWVLLQIARWRKFGNSLFKMAEVPGVIGGKLSGVIEVPAKVRPEDGFHLTLSCINEVTSGSGKNRSTRENVLWQDTCVMARELAERDPTRSAIPVAFGIPYDSRECDESDSDNEILWRLEVKASVSGADYHAQFEVPVFKTAASSEGFVLDDSALAGYAAEPDPERDLAATGVRVTPLPSGGVRLDLPMARHKGLAVSITIFELIWLGAIVVMIKLGAPLLFPIIFSAFGLLIGYFTLDLWFTSSRIEAEHGVLTFSCGLLGGKTQTLTFDDIETIEHKMTTQSGKKAYYAIRVRTIAGRHHTIAKRLDGMRLAQTAIDMITDALTERA
ncbi:MAG: DUF3592 domain-containing protein [bacterium]|nr:DUF3592 domain-containing protein [bacterium]